MCLLHDLCQCMCLENAMHSIPLNNLALKIKPRCLYNIYFHSVPDKCLLPAASNLKMTIKFPADDNLVKIKDFCHGMICMISSC